jgi:hypothetical protein
MDRVSVVGICSPSRSMGHAQLHGHQVTSTNLVPLMSLRTLTSSSTLLSKKLHTVHPTFIMLNTNIRILPQSATRRPNTQIPIIKLRSRDLELLLNIIIILVSSRQIPLLTTTQTPDCVTAGFHSIRTIMLKVPNSIAI